MNRLSVEEAQAQLAQLIDGLAPGEEVLITRDDQPVAKLVGERCARRKPRQPGMAKNKVLYMAQDFDAPLEDLREYMQ